MIFSSLEFTIFFTIFFIFYWFVFNRNLKAQNLLILTGSYVFYAWWDWRFLFLLIGSTIIYFILGIYIEETTNEKKRKLLLYIGLLEGIIALLFFKYFNFFITSFIDAFSLFNIHLNIHTLNIILPLGISFYTFRMISYLLDVDKSKIKASRDWTIFFGYVSFFPSLISGPIDKAKTLIPQLEQKRVFDINIATDGLRQILWGLFKKLVIADNCSPIVNEIFKNYQTLPASSLLAGAFFFTIQIYADFSGYTDMAIGFAHLLGINITRNFNYPYFAQNIADYWRRWHMSLTTWLTDYIFTPASIKYRDYGNRGLIIAILITFLVSGLWHGANWTFIAWGLLHGCYYIPLILKGILNKKKKLNHNLLPSFTEFRNILGTFILVMFANILFRAENISQALSYFRGLFSTTMFSIPKIMVVPGNIFIQIIIAVFIFIEWIQREKQHALQIDNIKNQALRWATYFLILIFCLAFFRVESKFVYFKF